MEDELIIYNTDDGKADVKLYSKDGVIWMNQQQMSLLFDTSKQNVSLHILNILKEKELEESSVVKDYLTTAADGKKYRTQYYNLDVIISVGYRVKSQRGTQFRIWATGILKDYLLRGYALNNRLANIEGQLETQQKILEEHSNKIDFFVRTSLPPVEGIFYDGQMLEPFAFVNNLIRSARKRIVLIDNYVDETVLLRLAERAKNVTAKIYTQQTSPSLNVALAQHNKQYEPIDLCIFTKSHDRFLIIDSDVYHIGASIKDLGKRWFAFCKMQLQADEMITKLI